MAADSIPEVQLLTPYDPTVLEPSGGAGITIPPAVGIQLISGQQLYTGSYANPNTQGLIPTSPQLSAKYTQEPSIQLNNEWQWDVPTQAWIQTIGP